MSQFWKCVCSFHVAAVTTVRLTYSWKQRSHYRLVMFSYFYQRNWKMPVQTTALSFFIHLFNGINLPIGIILSLKGVASESMYSINRYHPFNGAGVARCEPSIKITASVLTSSQIRDFGWDSSTLKPSSGTFTATRPSTDQPACWTASYQTDLLIR